MVILGGGSIILWGILFFSWHSGRCLGFLEGWMKLNIVQKEDFVTGHFPAETGIGKQLII